MDAYRWLDLPVGQVERVGVHTPEVTAPSIATEDSWAGSWLSGGGAPEPGLLQGQTADREWGYNPNDGRVCVQNPYC